MLRLPLPQDGGQLVPFYAGVFAPLGSSFLCAITGHVIALFWRLVGLSFGSLVLVLS